MVTVQIDVNGELLDQMRESLLLQEGGESILSQDATRQPSSTLSDLAPLYETIGRVQGLAIKIFADEHPPPHFHVSYQGQNASFSILDCARLEGVRGLERYEERIRIWWRVNRALLIEKWNSSRPTDCPVGPISL